MVIKWRPSEWKNPDWWGERESEAYEAGADAMLETLRKRGWQSAGDIWNVAENKKGSWVFIPNDVKE